MTSIRFALALGAPQHMFFRCVERLVFYFIFGILIIYGLGTPPLGRFRSASRASRLAGRELLY